VIPNDAPSGDNGSTGNTYNTYINGATLQPLNEADILEIIRRWEIMNG
jgi:hypothetical protein